MSMIDAIGRYGAAIRKAHARSKATRALNSLPPEVQKDIGWPVPPHADVEAVLAGVIWSAAR